MKWTLLGIGAVALGLTAAALYFPLLANPRITAELRNEPAGERARKVMLLTLPSGREIPVNYLREGSTVHAGADGPWWRELRGQGARVELLVMGETLLGHARAIENDREHTRDVFARLRPSVPRWLPAWLDGVLVAITLEPATPTDETERNP